MDYEMMVKEAYENIMGEIEKEALDYSAKSDYWPEVAHHAVRTVSKDPDRYQQAQKAAYGALSKIPSELASAWKSWNRYDNAMESIKGNHFMFEHHPAFKKASKGRTDASYRIGDLEKKQRSLRSFIREIEDRVGHNPE